MDKKNKVIAGFEFPMRLGRYLSLAGIAARRKSELLISEGKVSVNGKLIKEPGFKVDKTDLIEFEQRVIDLEQRIYIMLNKPRGYLCSAFDPFAEKTVFQLVDLPDKRLFTVGRLDLDSEGLLLLTDDGDFAEKITHPRYEIPKTYLVQTDKVLSGTDIESMLKGKIDDGEFLQLEKVVRKSDHEYLFTMKEGKKREIRRLVKSVSAKVIRLRRISVGHLNLGRLPLGEWRMMTDKEIADSLKK